MIFIIAMLLMILLFYLSFIFIIQDSNRMYGEDADHEALLQSAAKFGISMP